MRGGGGAEGREVRDGRQGGGQDQGGHLEDGGGGRLEDREGQAEGEALADEQLWRAGYHRADDSGKMNSQQNLSALSTICT